MIDYEISGVVNAVTHRPNAVNRFVIGYVNEIQTFDFSEKQRTRDDRPVRPVNRLATSMCPVIVERTVTGFAMWPISVNHRQLNAVLVSDYSICG